MQLLLDFVEDDLDPSEVLLGLGPLRAGLGDVIVELGDPRDVVQDPPALRVRCLDDPLDVPLLHEVVALGTDACVCQEAVELVEGRLPVVHVEIRVVPVRNRLRKGDVPSELDLVGLDRDPSIRVVEDEGHLAVGGALLVLPAVPDEVGEALRADRLGALRAEDEENRVRDVRLPGPVRPGHRRVSLQEGHADPVREGFEVLHLDFFQKHDITAMEGADRAVGMPIPSWPF